MSIRERIEEKLRTDFEPLHLEVVNESHMHDVPEGAESHFKVILVTDRFDGKPLLSRHRAVNQLLSEELRAQIHALALHTMTPEEWFTKGGQAPVSPLCQGGSKKT